MELQRTWLNCVYAQRFVKGRTVNDKTGYLTEISKQSVEAVDWLVLTLKIK
jgi:hypothetical protein